MTSDASCRRTQIVPGSGYLQAFRANRLGHGIGPRREWLDHVEVHLVTHPVGQVKPMHTHDPPQDHVIVMRSGRMRWTVEDQTLEAEAGDVIVTPAGQRMVMRFSATSSRASSASTRLRYRKPES
jgi:mannose-6-phosphate isomerase-like protein (cupin superfamily)